MERQSATTPLDMPDATKEALLKLAEFWDRRAMGKWEDADIELSKRISSQGAVIRTHGSRRG